MYYESYWMCWPLLTPQNALGIDSCVMGKSNLYSRTNINALTTPSPSLKLLPDPPTGLAAFSPFLAEDNMIGLSLWHELHLKHAMTGDVALDFLGTLSIWDYIARRSRWIRVRKRMTPIPATMLEPFTESIFGGLCGMWAIARLFGANVAALWLVHMATWLAVDLSVRRHLGTNVRGMGPPEGKLAFVGAWLVREVLAMPIYLYALCGDQVIWRGKTYRIGQSGKL
jgi:ceramide glucosyltransferase